MFLCGLEFRIMGYKKTAMYNCSFLVFIKKIVRFIYFLPFGDSCKLAILYNIIW